MRVLKVLSCAIMCALIFLSSCFYVFAAEPESSKPKSYSQMTEEELLARGQVPISYLLKEIQKHIDKTVKDENGKEIRLYDFVKEIQQEDGTKKRENVPIGKFSIQDFIKDKNFLLFYACFPNEKSSEKFKPADKDTSFIVNLVVFDNDSFIDVKKNEICAGSPEFLNGAIYDDFSLIVKPESKILTEVFTVDAPNGVSENYLLHNVTYSADSNGQIFGLQSRNCKQYYGEILTESRYGSFYMNFMPPGGEGMLEPYVVTDKDISSEKKYVDDPNRPDGNYKYAVYEFENDKMVRAQYFIDQPSVTADPEIAGITRYHVTWKKDSYVWNCEKNTYTDFTSSSAQTADYLHSPSTGRKIKFSWKPFNDYNGEIYQDNAVLVDGNGFVTNRPTGNYPYVMRRYVNSQLYETFFFQYKPSVSIHDVIKDYNKTTITANFFVTTDGTGGASSHGNPWYSKKQDVFFVPNQNAFRIDHLKETYHVNVRFNPDGTKDGNYVTFNWDAGAEYEELFKFNPFYNPDGSDLDDFYEDFDEDITDDDGNPVGGGDGSKPGQSNKDGFDFGDFEFNADSLWRYANEFLNFCKNTFAVLPSFIWQIVATGFVIVVILRILGR